MNVNNSELYSAALFRDNSSVMICRLKIQITDLNNFKALSYKFLFAQ